MRKTYVRCLYAGGRSALRLEDLATGRRLALQAVREDQKTDYLEPVHKLHLAGRALLATGELEPAERAFRLALAAKGPPRRDWLYGLLAEVAQRRGDLDNAQAWIEANVPSHRRSAALWRQLGDLRRDQGNRAAALLAYQSSLAQDRMGRHLTLVRMGDLRRAAGEWKQAEADYRRASEFRRRLYLSEDPAALAGLSALLEERGRAEEAAEVRGRLASLGRAA
jgi:predicted Zn-dependent protease